MCVRRRGVGGICCVQGGWVFAVCRVGGYLLCAKRAFAVYLVGICCVQGG